MHPRANKTYFRCLKSKFSMKALVLEETNTPLIYKEVEHPLESVGHQIVELRAAALNHRDVWIRKGQYARIKLPVILGSDGAGFAGDRPVIINPGMQWGDRMDVQGDDFHILGMPTNGTFAQRVSVPDNQIYDMPEHLSFEEAASIPLAGVTAWRAVVTQGQVRPTDRALITGIGGGVAQWAMQFALSKGAHVSVTSGTPAKLERAMQAGAHGGYDYHDVEWTKHAREEGGFDLVIDGAGGTGLAQVMKICNPGARLVIYGGTAGPIPALSPQVLFWKQLHIIGSTMGSPSDFQDMITWIRDQRIVPILDRVFPLEEGSAAFDRMSEGLQFGKIILQIPA